MFRVIYTKSFFEEHLKFFDNKELVKLSKFNNKLKLYPFIGRGLRVPFVREFKTTKGKRAYFIIYEEFKLVLFVSLSNKKGQKSAIDTIFKNLNEFKDIAKKKNYYNS